MTQVDSWILHPRVCVSKLQVFTISGTAICLWEEWCSTLFFLWFIAIWYTHLYQFNDSTSMLILAVPFWALKYLCMYMLNSKMITTQYFFMEYTSIHPFYHWVVFFLKYNNHFHYLAITNIFKKSVFVFCLFASLALTVGTHNPLDGRLLGLQF